MLYKHRPSNTMEFTTLHGSTINLSDFRVVLEAKPSSPYSSDVGRGAISGFLRRMPAELLNIGFVMIDMGKSTETQASRTEPPSSQTLPGPRRARRGPQGRRPPSNKEKLQIVADLGGLLWLQIWLRSRAWVRCWPCTAGLAETIGELRKVETSFS